MTLVKTKALFTIRPQRQQIFGVSFKSMDYTENAIETDSVCWQIFFSNYIHPDLM